MRIFLISLMLFALPVFASAQTLEKQLADNTADIKEIKRAQLEIWDSLNILQQDTRDRLTTIDVNARYLKDIMSRLEDIEKRLLALETAKKKETEKK